MTIPERPLSAPVNTGATIESLEISESTTLNKSEIKGILKVDGKEFAISALVSNKLDKTQIRDTILKMVKVYEVTANTVSFSMSNDKITHKTKTEDGEKEKEIKIKRDVDSEKLTQEIRSLLDEPAIKDKNIPFPKEAPDTGQIRKAIIKIKTTLKVNPDNEQLKRLLKNLKDLLHDQMFKEIFSVKMGASTT